MPRQILKAAQTGTSKGRLQIQVTTEQFQPIKDAKVSISYSGDPQSTVEQITTNISGQTDEIELNAPPIEYSLNEENVEQPYADYTINVIAEGFEPINISGTEILADTTALQEVSMQPVAANAQPSNIVIPAHTLYGNYPPKIAETEIKPVGESGEIVLSQVVIPEFVIVHDGAPTDSTAKNYWVRYRDYIKNVASSEIYATWPENTITANVLAIMSFTLNRVYTEWYKNQGFNFSITSSTAFDHKWMYGRNIYNNISRIVDSIFNNYLSRPNVKQPIFTQYCDGKKVQCPNWMSYVQ